MHGDNKKVDKIENELTFPSFHQIVGDQKEIEKIGGSYDHWKKDSDEVNGVQIALKRIAVQENEYHIYKQPKYALTLYCHWFFLSIFAK